MLVAGGGPAGAAAAFRLARLGYDVAIVDASSRADPQRVEVCAPSIAALADALPLHSALRDSGPAVGTHLRWSGDAEYVPAMPGTKLIRRGIFDHALRAAIGVPCLAARARMPKHVDGLWHIPVTTQYGTQTLAARFLIDAGGRSGALLGKRHPVGPITIATTSVWSGAGSAPGTLTVEAIPGGWCWGASPARGELHTAIFFDPPANAANAVETLRACSLFAGALRAATLVRNSVTDATPRLAADVAGENWLRAGDSASAPDPLSSQGLAMALRAGIHAAAAAHTILSGRDTEAALAFFRASVAGTTADHTATTARLYAATPERTTFWNARRTPEPAPKPIAAFLPDGFIALTPRVTFANMPVLIGDHIDTVPALQVPDSRPIAWISGIPAPTLLAGLREPANARDVVQVWNRFFPAEQANAILISLLDSGILEAKTATAT